MVIGVVVDITEACVASYSGTLTASKMGHSRLILVQLGEGHLVVSVVDDAGSDTVEHKDPSVHRLPNVH